MKYRLKIINLLIIGILFLSLASCVIGSGNIEREERAVIDFNRVLVGSDIELEIEQGENESIIIEAEENIIPLISTEVKDGELIVKFNRSSIIINKSKPPKIYIIVTDLDEIKLLDDAKVSCNYLESEVLKIYLETGSSTFLNIDANELYVFASSGSMVSISGKVEKQNIYLKNDVYYLAEDLKSNKCEAQIGNRTNATVNVSNNITAEISSSGNLTYIGNPEIVKKVSFGGSITKVNSK